MTLRRRELERLLSETVRQAGIGYAATILHGALADHHARRAARAREEAGQ